MVHQDRRRFWTHHVAEVDFERIDLLVGLGLVSAARRCLPARLPLTVTFLSALSTLPSRERQLSPSTTLICLDTLDERTISIGRSSTSCVVTAPQTLPFPQLTRHYPLTHPFSSRPSPTRACRSVRLSLHTLILIGLLVSDKNFDLQLESRSRPLPRSFTAARPFGTLLLCVQLLNLHQAAYLLTQFVFQIIAKWPSRAARFFAACAFMLAQAGTNLSTNAIASQNDLTMLFPRSVL